MYSHLKLGSKVSFLREVGQGVIIEFEGDECLVEDEHGFDTWHKISEIVPLMSVSEEDLFSNNDGMAKITTDSARKKPQASKSVEEWRIDLHIENLIDTTRGLANHDIVLLQLKHFKLFLSRAESAKAGRLLVIHGQGTGKLKSEILEIVRGIKGAEMHDANIQQGASVIERKYNVR